MMSSGTQGDLIIVLEKPFLLISFELDCVSAALRHFEKAAKRIGRCAGDGTGTEEVSRHQVAAAARMMRNHLTHGPIKRSRIHAR